MASMALKTCVQSAALCNQSFLSLIPLPEREQVIKSSEFLLLPPQLDLFRRGDRSDEVFLILEGNIEISRSEPYGKRIVLAHRGAGEIVGEMEVILNATRSADAETTTTCKIGRISSEHFHRLLQETPSVALALVHSLSDRLTQASDKSLEFATQDVPTRVLNLLIAIAKPHQTKEGYALVVEKRPTHSHIAKSVGTSREVVCRALKLLEDSNEIFFRDNRILIRHLHRRTKT